MKHCSPLLNVIYSKSFMCPQRFLRVLRNVSRFWRKLRTPRRSYLREALFPRSASNPILKTRIRQEGGELNKTWEFTKKCARLIYWGVSHKEQPCLPRGIKSGKFNQQEFFFRLCQLQLVVLRHHSEYLRFSVASAATQNTNYCWDVGANWDFCQVPVKITAPLSGFKWDGRWTTSKAQFAAPRKPTRFSMLEFIFSHILTNQTFLKPKYDW